MGALSKLKRLSINQKITLALTASSVLVGLASLVVSIVAVMIASNSQDIKVAIANLSQLATQTKRQADNASGQLGALREQVEEARAQTKAISDQTEAIKSSSDANIKSATAQQKMADVTAKAQVPDVDLRELQINGLNGEPEKDDWVPIKLFWRFSNTGGSALTTKKVIYGLEFGKSLPEKMPDGFVFDGQDLVVTPAINSAFAPAEPLSFRISHLARDNIKSGNWKVFFFAKYYYEDSLGVKHSKCFGRAAILNSNGEYNFSVPAGGAAYKCAS